jgi:hypothetical protein
MHPPAMSPPVVSQPPAMSPPAVSQPPAMSPPAVSQPPATAATQQPPKVNEIVEDLLPVPESAVSPGQIGVLVVNCEVSNIGAVDGVDIVEMAKAKIQETQGAHYRHLELYGGNAALLEEVVEKELEAAFPEGVGLVTLDLSLQAAHDAFPAFRKKAQGIIRGRC